VSIPRLHRVDRGDIWGVPSLTIGMAAAAGVLVGTLGEAAQRWEIGIGAFVALVAAFLVAERLDVLLEVGGSTLSLTLSHVVLVFGLFHVDPVPLVVARVGGGVLSLLVLRERRTWTQHSFNVALFAIESTVVVALVCEIVVGRPAVDRPGDWLAVLVAVVAGSLASLALAGLGVRLADGAGIVRIGAETGLVVLAELGNGALGLLGAVATSVHPAGAVLLVPIVGGSYAAYRSYTSWRARHRELQRIHGFTAAIAQCTTMEDVARVTMRDACSAVQARTADVYLVEDPVRRRPAAWYHLRADGVCERVERWLVGDVVLDVASDQRAVLVAEGPDDVVAVPVLTAGRRVGVLAVRNRAGTMSRFGPRELALVSSFANHAGTALENVQLIDALRREGAEREHQYLHDALTGLGNRRLFTIRVSEAIARAHATGQAVAVFLVDLDGFKDVNDTLGHGVGDGLLQVTGSRLAGVAGDPSAVARLAGDEFAVLVEGAGVEDAIVLGARVVQALRAPAMVEGIRLSVGASVGVAVFPDHGDDASLLLQRADMALDVAKRQPERPVTSFDASTAETTARRLAIAAALRQAVDDARFDVVYQPLADLDTGRIVSAEALVRWEHPVLGAVAPSEFVPVAERIGLMEPLTRYVLEVVLTQLATWHDSGLELPVSVNVSARNLLEDAFPDTLFEMLDRYGVEPRRLTLEITETALMQEAERALTVLDRVSARGVGLSIDDFGTGYSSLAYLRRLPVTEVKIDRSFVADLADNPNDAVIAGSIVALARRLDLRVVAEGIEDDRTRSLLVGMGCRHGQGFRLGRPMTATALGERLAAQADR
jgi:diguanylate cyclase (GGDEF)-like protein